MIDDDFDFSEEELEGEWDYPVDDSPLPGIFSAESLLALNDAVAKRPKSEPQAETQYDSEPSEIKTRDKSPYGVSASMLLGENWTQPPSLPARAEGKGKRSSASKTKPVHPIPSNPEPAFDAEFIVNETAPFIFSAPSKPITDGISRPKWVERPPQTKDGPQPNNEPDTSVSKRARELDAEARANFEKAAKATAKEAPKYVVDKETLICHLAWCDRAKEIPKARRLTMSRIPHQGRFALCATCFREKTPEQQLKDFLNTCKPASKSEIVSKAIVTYCEELGVHAEVKAGTAYITTIAGEWYFTYNDRPIVLHHKNSEKRYDWKGNLLKNHYHIQQQKFYSPAHALAYIAIHDKPERALAIGLQQLEAMRRNQRRNQQKSAQ